MPTNKRAMYVLAAVFGGFFLLFLVFLGLAFSAIQGQKPGTKGNGPKIGVVELNGQITGDPSNGIHGRTEAEQIRDFAEDESVKAVLVRIDSPGGAVAPAQEIWEEIRRTRQKKKVVCSMGQVAASGGYYIAVACDRIVANPGTLTGSIGVISQFLNAKELVAAAKLQAVTLKTGALKDTGSPFREFNDQDRVYFEGLLSGIFDQFMQAIAEGRGKTIEEIRPVADGRVLSGAEALEVGLVDKLGNFRTAVDELMALAGLEGEPQLVYPEKEEMLPFMKLLRSGARTAAGEVTRGAVEGLTGQAGALQSGVLLLAPELAGGLTVR